MVAVTSVISIPSSTKYFDLGDWHRPGSTESQDAQVWFARGLAGSYYFNHKEAGHCFKQVIAHDPTCAMGYWGIAYVRGPNYNKAWAFFDPKDMKETQEECHMAIQKAKTLAVDAIPVEQALVEALAQRILTSQPADEFTSSLWADADSMRHVSRNFG